MTDLKLLLFCLHPNFSSYEFATGERCKQELVSRRKMLRVLACLVENPVHHAPHLLFVYYVIPIDFNPVVLVVFIVFRQFNSYASLFLIFCVDTFIARKYRECAERVTKIRQCCVVTLTHIHAKH